MHQPQPPLNALAAVAEGNKQATSSLVHSFRRDELLSDLFGAAAGASINLVCGKTPRSNDVSSRRTRAAGCSSSVILGGFLVCIFHSYVQTPKDTSHDVPYILSFGLAKACYRYVPQAQFAGRLLPDLFWCAERSPLQIWQLPSTSAVLLP